MISSFSPEERPLKSDNSIATTAWRNPLKSFPERRRRMRVLFITRKYPPQIGGMENLSFHLTTSIQCQKTIIALKQSRIHFLWFIPYALIKSLFIAYSFDIIHLGDPVLSIIGVFLKLLYRKPIAMTLHGLDISYNNPLYQLYLKLFAKKFDRYICISRKTEKEAHRKGFLSTVIIPVGVNQNYFKISRSKEALEKLLSVNLKGKFVLLTVGRLVKRKGMAWFVENVMPKLPDKCIYLVVGEGKEREGISWLIKEKKLEGRVWLLGKISNKDLEKVYQGADIFIMPNIPVLGDQEGFGIVALEAAACGLTVMAANLEGIKDAIIDQKTGFLLRSKHVSTWLYKLNFLLDNNDFRKEFGLKARELVREKFSWERVSQRYLEEFRKLI